MPDPTHPTSQVDEFSDLDDVLPGFAAEARDRQRLIDQLHRQPGPASSPASPRTTSAATSGSGGPPQPRSGSSSAMPDAPHPPALHTPQPEAGGRDSAPVSTPAPQRTEPTPSPTQGHAATRPEDPRHRDPGPGDPTPGPRKSKPHNGAPPYGYRAGGAGTLVPVLSEQRVIRTILTLAEAGTSATRIARLLNDQGIPTRRQRRWWGTTVIGILQRVAPELVESEKDRPVPSDPRDRRRVAERRRSQRVRGLPTE